MKKLYYRSYSGCVGLSKMGKMEKLSYWNDTIHESCGILALKLAINCPQLSNKWNAWLLYYEPLEDSSSSSENKKD